jgi:hypothetical protein
MPQASERLPMDEEEEEDGGIRSIILAIIIYKQ